MKKRYFHIENGKVTEVPVAVGSALFRLVEERDEKRESESHDEGRE